MNPRILTISGITCSGKSYLQKALVESGEFVKLVTSTTRPPRPGEIHGEDYNFMSSGIAEMLIENQNFVEYTGFNNHLYGLTKFELEEKLGSDKIACAILTPEGVKTYQEFFKNTGVTIVSIFIDCPIDLLIQRLTERTFNEKNITRQYLEQNFNRVREASISNFQYAYEWDTILSAKQLKNTDNSNQVIDFLIKMFK